MIVDINSNRWNAIRFAAYVPLYDVNDSVYTARIILVGKFLSVLWILWHQEIFNARDANAAEDIYFFPARPSRLGVKIFLTEA
jgi:hypothetical protein